MTSSGINWGTPIVSDDFNGSSLDLSKWSVYDSPNAAKFPRSPAAVRTVNGELQLIGGFDAQGKDVSGGIAGKTNQMYGRWEVRLRADHGAGYSAVSLLWPLSERWPTDGEIDMVEALTGSTTGAGMFAHNGARDTTVQGHVRADFTQWHTIAVDWLPGKIVYSVDGVTVFTVSGSSGAVPSTSPMHLALQNDKGCVDGIPCRDASTPAQVIMHVDWVHIYRYPA